MIHALVPRKSFVQGRIILLLCNIPSRRRSIILSTSTSAGELSDILNCAVLAFVPYIMSARSRKKQNDMVSAHSGAYLHMRAHMSFPSSTTYLLRQAEKNSGVFVTLCSPIQRLVARRKKSTRPSTSELDKCNLSDPTCFVSHTSVNQCDRCRLLMTSNTLPRVNFSPPARVFGWHGSGIFEIIL